MQNKVLRIYFPFFLFIVLGCALHAQTKIYSPYSRIGFGDIPNSNLHYLKFGGEYYSAFHSAGRVSLDNPASFGSLSTTAFDLAVNARWKQLSDDESTANSWTGNLNYLSLAFPLRNPINEVLERIETDFSWGMGIHLKPYSQVGYDILSQRDDPELGLVNRNFVGEGGTQIVGWSNGWKYKNLSAGLEVGYLFGEAKYRRNVFFPSLPNSFFNQFDDDIEYSGFAWQAGAQYEWVLRREIKADGTPGRPSKSLTLGVHGNSSWDINSEASQLYTRQSSQFIWADTLAFNSGVEGTTTLPGRIGIGIMYKELNKLELGVDLRMDQWSNYQNPHKAETTPLENSWKIAAGVAYTPQAFDLNKFFRRVTYTGGLFYGKDPRSFEGDRLTEYGLNAGASFPFVSQRQLTMVNLGVKLGRRGTESGLSETYVNIGFAVTVTDNQWFIKRKYD